MTKVLIAGRKVGRRGAGNRGVANTVPRRLTIGESTVAAAVSTGSRRESNRATKPQDVQETKRVLPSGIIGLDAGKPERADGDGGQGRMDARISSFRAQATARARWLAERHATCF
jgi:hypothetical protein